MPMIALYTPKTRRLPSKTNAYDHAVHTEDKLHTGDKRPVHTEDGMLHTGDERHVHTEDGMLHTGDERLVHTEDNRTPMINLCTPEMNL